MKKTAMCIVYFMPFVTSIYLIWFRLLPWLFSFSNGVESSTGVLFYKVLISLLVLILGGSQIPIVLGMSGLYLAINFNKR